MFLSEIVHALKDVSVFVFVLCSLVYSANDGTLYISQDSSDGPCTAETLASNAQGPVEQMTRLSKLTSSREFMPERKAHLPLVQGNQGSNHDSKLLAAPLTPANYKDKFHLLIKLEEKEHEEALKRYAILSWQRVLILFCTGIMQPFTMLWHISY